jgi:hypothetical protein
VQALASLQAVPFAASGAVHMPVAGLQTPATWQASSGLQVTLPPAVQVPDWQVAAQPVPHGVPSDMFGFEQAPVVGSQKAIWQASAPPQITGFEPMHVPAWQVSVCVQASPSLQVVPVRSVTAQKAVPSHASVMHGTLVQVIVVPPAQAPAPLQVSPWVQALPSLQAAPVRGVTVQDAVPLHARVLH